MMKTFFSTLAVLSAASAGTICSKDNVGQVFGHESSCTKFHQCSPIGLLTFDCQVGTFFNKTTGTCECGPKKTCGGVSFGHCPLTVQTDICVKRPVGDVVAHPFSCTAFYQCSNYGPALYSCPEGTAFNSAVKTCDSVGKVKCARLATACCGSFWLTGCCSGITECRPCEIQWLDPKLCCIPCIKCLCIPCASSGPTAPIPCTTTMSTPRTTTTTTTVNTTTTACPCLTTTSTTVIPTTTTSCPCSCTCPPSWLGPCQCQRTCPCTAPTPPPRPCSC